MAAYANMKASLARLQKFLDIPSKPPKVQMNGTVNDVVVSDATLAHPATKNSNDGGGEGRVRGATAAADSVVLRDVNIEVPKGSLTAIVGGVGAGKSTLLSAIIGELAPTSGRAVCSGDIGYVPQKAVVISGSIEDNVLLGRKLDRARLGLVMEASAFGHDLDLLDDGINTVIGERGTTLSGGQQQRLCIARALYGDPELLIMDDPLSAVDPAVCRRIFASVCMQRKSRRKTTVLVCSQLHLLKHCDHIVYLENKTVVRVYRIPFITTNNNNNNNI